MAEAGRPPSLAVATRHHGKNEWKSIILGLSSTSEPEFKCRSKSTPQEDIMSSLMSIPLNLRWFWWFAQEAVRKPHLKEIQAIAVGAHGMQSYFPGLFLLLDHSEIDPKSRCFALMPYMPQNLSRSNPTGCCQPFATLARAFGKMSARKKLPRNILPDDKYHVAIVSQQEPFQFCLLCALIFK